MIERDYGYFSVRTEAGTAWEYDSHTSISAVLHCLHECLTSRDIDIPAQFGWIEDCDATTVHANLNGNVPTLIECSAIISAAQAAYAAAVEQIDSNYADRHLCIIGDSAGIYTPKLLAEMIRTGSGWNNYSSDDVGILEQGPDHPEYWDAYDVIIGNAQCIVGEDSHAEPYILCPGNGGLFLVPQEYPEGFWDRNPH